MKLVLALVAAACHLLSAPGEDHIKAAAAAYESGNAALRAKSFSSAAEFFQKALTIEPTFTEARQALVSIYVQSGQRLETAAAITKLLQIQPGLSRERLMLAQILLEEKQPQRALAQFSFVLKDDPDKADALLGFAIAAKQIGLDARAAQAMERGRKRYPLDARFKKSD
jgi:tetratricopeptide (TPR) repeat protein